VFPTEATTEVFAELDRASAKFGAFHSNHEGFAVLKEEVDELWDAIKARKTGAGACNDEVRKEAIQVAAMALRFLIDCC